jgi:hypothetical protein
MISAAVAINDWEAAQACIANALTDLFPIDPRQAMNSAASILHRLAALELPEPTAADGGRLREEV